MVVVLFSKRNIWLPILGSAVSMTPLYIFGSGGMQPSHMLLGLLMLVVFGTSKIPLTGITWALFSFFAYSLSIESIYGIIYSTVNELINPMYVLYNFFLVAAIYIAVREHGLDAIKYGIIVATAIALVSVIITGVDLTTQNEDVRPVGTFNNPNQLGYFSTCVLSIAYLLRHHRYLGFWSAQLLYFSGVALSILSLSKAAMVANCSAVVFMMIPRTVRGWVGLLLFIVPVIGFGLIDAFDDPMLEELLFIKRFLFMFEESDSSLAARGYFVFLEGDTAQILFGMGVRNVEQLLGHEVHSTIGSALNNYGFIGVLLFVGIMWFWAKSLVSAYGMVVTVPIMLPPILYGLTHNGSRFTIFWILVAASYAMAQRVRANRMVSNPASKKQ